MIFFFGPLLLGQLKSFDLYMGIPELTVNIPEFNVFPLPVMHIPPLPENATLHGTDSYEPVLQMTNSSNITIQECSFQHSIAQAIVLSEISGYVNINYCKFVNNAYYKGHGAIVNVFSSSLTRFQLSVNINTCDFIYNRGASLIYVNDRIFKHNINLTIFSSEFKHNEGSSVCIINQKLYLTGRILFQENQGDAGIGVYIRDHSALVFGENSNVTFLQNFARSSGSAIFSSNYSTVMFDKNSKVMFINNKASYGTVYSMANSNIMIKATCKVIFNSNIALGNGGAVFSTHSNISIKNNAYTEFSKNVAGVDTRINEVNISPELEAYTRPRNSFGYGGAVCAVHAHISFEGNSIAKFINNKAVINGGSMYIENDSSVSFEDNSSTRFSDNTAFIGGSIFASKNSNVSFKDNSTTKFSNNKVQDRIFGFISHGGAISAYYDSHISFEDNSATTFSNNRADEGGAIYAKQSSYVSFKDDSTTNFSDNSAAYYGGALSTLQYSHVSFEGNSTTKFSKGRSVHGGAIYASQHSHVSFQDNSTTELNYNDAVEFGGALYTHHSNVSFEDISTTTFNNNIAHKGGAISANYLAQTLFKDNSVTEFSNNKAVMGGAMYASEHAQVVFEDDSTTKFSSNRADYYGGAIDIGEYTYVSFVCNSTTQFSNNIARGGGAMFVELSSHSTFENNSITQFSNNKADIGGAILANRHSLVKFKHNSVTKFNNNSGKNGRAIYANNCNISFEDSSTTIFCNNEALSESNALLTRRSNIIIDTSIPHYDFPVSNGNNSILTCQSNIIFDGDCTVSFINNKSKIKGIFYPISTYSSELKARGNFAITFNHQPAKWCANTCLSYYGKDDVRIDNSGVVWCRSKYQFTCTGRNCQCKNLKDTIENTTNNSLLILSDKIILSSAFNLIFFQNLSIIGRNDLILICVDDGSFEVESCSNITIQDITWIGCEKALKIFHSKYVGIRNCSFLYSMSKPIEISEPSGKITVDYCKFMHNNHNIGHGSAIHYSSNNPSSHHDELTIDINNCDFSFNIGSKSVIYIKQSHKHTVHHNINNSTFCNNQATSIYLSGHLYINGELLFENNVAETGTGLYISDYSTVVLGENSTVKFISNTADHYGAAIFLNNHSSVVFDKNSMVNFRDNYATNGTVYSKDNSVVLFTATCEVMFDSNKATQYGAAMHSVENSQIKFTGNSNVTFSNNIMSAGQSNPQFGGTIFTENNGQVTFTEQSTTLFSNNIADFGAGIFSVHNSDVKFGDHSMVMFNNNIDAYCGVLTSLFSRVSFSDNADVTYSANTLSCQSNICFKHSAGAICSLQGTNVTLSGYSSVTFTKNTADFGSGAMVFSESIFTIKEHSTVTLNNNIAEDSSGGAIACYNSNVTVKGNSNVTFSGNKATQSGGALYLYSMSKIIFTDNSKSTFINNTAIINGGAILNDQSSEITFKGNSTVHFNYNRAYNGGMFYCTNSSGVTFKEMSMISFYCSKAKQNGGVGYFTLNSNILFEGIAAVKFDSNMAEENGGVLCSIKTVILFKENCNVTFTNNRALKGGAISTDNSYVFSTGSSLLSFITNEAIQNGGAIYVTNSTNITTKEKSILKLKNNHARQHGGVIHSINSILTFKGNSTVHLNYNEAMQNGGAMCTIYSDVVFSEFTNITFHKNTAVYGGAIVAENQSSITAFENAEILFLDNIATHGGALYFFNMCKMIFRQNSISSFINNRALLHGGSIFTKEYSSVAFMEESKVTFNSNAGKTGGTLYAEYALITFNNNSVVRFNNSRSSENGGVIYSSNSTVLFKGNSIITFTNNRATVNGGALYFDSISNVSFSDNTSETFENNKALHGGAICVSSNSNITFKEYSTALFKNNSAYIDGGAINIFTNSSFTVKDYTAIQFNANNAQYGGAMYFDTTHSSLVINRNMKFSNNIAKFAGSAIFFDSTMFCNRSCLYSRIINGIRNESYNFIASPPSTLVISDPAVCIDDDTEMECNKYLLRHVMLGEEINVPATVLDYFNHSTYRVRFLLHYVPYQNYSLSGLTEFLLSSGSISGITIKGNKSLTKPLNCSINIILHKDRNLGRTQISVNLTIELTPCHLGFWQYPNSESCECYNASDFVYCSGSTSTIKRGYWFGSIKENKPTVTFCPINYCNFTCCETSNGYYHLSPLRDNQCRSHRTGPACGSCKDGYTLSFDSTECVDVDNCTAGQTVLVILLTVIYWIVMFTLVFAIMYYKVGIGYLYSITYYYSIVDILLNQNIHASRGLYLTTTILSSFSKITPQFLGELCLTTGMSGIDQQFIHYIHPSAVILILAIISLLARRSRRISTIISRGIIHVICLLLLLSYTSVASTSLLLMRSLKFLDIDKVYTYPSPDIEYLHGRHLRSICHSSDAMHSFHCNRSSPFAYP